MRLRRLGLATLVSAALLIGTDVTAQATYEDQVPVISVVKQRVKLLHRRARRQRNVGRVQPFPVEPTPTPTPTPTTPTAYPAGGLTAEQVASYARAAGFPESVIPTMVAIAYRESHFYPGAINASSGACGLWQIYPAMPGCTNPATNAALAYQKYAASGLAPWSM